MKKKNKTPTSSETNTHDGQLSKDAKPLKKFEALLGFTQYSKAKVIIEAASIEEAWEKAEEIEPDELNDEWNLFDGEMLVASVDPLAEGDQDDE